MIREQLFTRHIPDTSEAPVVDRQSPLADYVLDQMPTDLLAVANGGMNYDELNASQEAVIDKAADAIDANTDPEVAEVTQLDLLFMLGGRLPAGADMERLTSPSLKSIIAVQRDRFSLPDHMDYELVIDVNSREFYRTGQRDMRTYADGPFGLDERDFYVGHYNTEPRIKGIAFGIHSIVERPDEVDAEEVLQAAAAEFREFGKDMQQYRKMPPEAFTYIRPYLEAYPDGTRNASGAFMPSVQLAEVAMHAPTDEFLHYVNEAMPYFPRWARGLMRQWTDESAQGNNLDNMIRSGRLDLSEAAVGTFRNIASQFATFRSTHRAAVEKVVKVPEGKEPLVSADAPRTVKGILARGERPIDEEGPAGTGGYNITNILLNGIYRMNDLARRIGRPEN
jgi:hypothetical protein